MAWTTPHLSKSASGSKSTATCRPSSETFKLDNPRPPGQRRAAFIFAKVINRSAAISGAYHAPAQTHDVIAKLAIERRLPTIFEARDYVDSGGLLSYGIRYHEMFEQGAAYIARILRGAHPRELPVVEASKFDIVLNS